MRGTHSAYGVSRWTGIVTMVAAMALLASACAAPAQPQPAAKAPAAAPEKAAAPAEKPAAAAPQPAAPAAKPAAQAPKPAAPAAAKVLKIGAAVPRTGQFHLEGELIKQGYDLWVNTVNAKGGIKVGNDTYTVQFIIYDDESDKNTTARLVEKLITEDKVDFIFGPFGSALTLAALAITEKYGKMFVNPSGNADAIFEQNPKLMIGIIPPAGVLVNAVVDMLAKASDPPKTVALVSKNDLFGQTQRKGASEYINKLGTMKIVFDSAYPAEAKDFATLIGQIKGTNADVILQLGHAECAQFYPQMRQLGVTPKAYFCSGLPPTDFAKVVGDAATGVYGYILGWDPRVPYCDDVIGCAKDYEARHKEINKKDSPPSYVTVNAAGAGVLLTKALQAAGTTDPKAIRDALDKMKVTIGAGPVDFDQVGRNRAGAVAVTQIFPGGKVELVWPPARQTQKPMYPAPTR